jgi:5-methylcytosine-specific restriction endonuclease McrA
MPEAPPTFKNTFIRKREPNKQKQQLDSLSYGNDWVIFREDYKTGFDEDGMPRSLCRHCFDLDIIKFADVLDHIEPVRVNPDRKLDETNIQPLCNSHHAKKTREDYEKYPNHYTSNK